MTISRDTIIATIQEHLSPQPSVLAIWLEGADATGYVDEYSDIDLCCSVTTKGALEETIDRAEAALESLGRLDLAKRDSRDHDFRSATFHLEGTSPYLLVDFDVYYDRGSTFTPGDPIERPRILFDRAGVVCFVARDAQADAAERSKRLKDLEGTAAQYARTEKYLRRGEFLEAFGYYHKWLLEPLIEVLRLRYTPLHPDYYIVHISRHLPADVLRQVEYCFQVGSLAELETKSRQALSLFGETVNYLRGEVKERR